MVSVLENDKNKAMTESDTRSGIWEDSIIQDYYINYYKNLSSRELDREFNEDILTLTRAYSKLPDSQREAFIEVLSRIIEFYMENKLEKEIDLSLHKILKI